MAKKSTAKEAVSPLDDLTSKVVNEPEEVFELDEPDSPYCGPPTLSVDVVCFESNAIIHIGSANTQEMAIAMADEHDLQPGQMVRVTPMVYFRVNHGDNG